MRLNALRPSCFLAIFILEPFAPHFPHDPTTPHARLHAYLHTIRAPTAAACGDMRSDLSTSSSPTLTQIQNRTLIAS